ncbi:MAG: Fic family protein [Cellulomonas sp.]
MTADPLLALADLPGVRAAIDDARSACERLRWHEAFRRRGREARAESGIRAARASAELEGARVPVARVRAMAVGDPGTGSADALVHGSLQAQVVVESLMPELGARSAPLLPPFAQLLATIHRAATAGWLDAGSVGRLRSHDIPDDLRGLGTAPPASDVAGRLELLGRVVDRSRAPALVVAAVAHGELIVLRPFQAGNGTVARALFRLLLTRGGLDPTGCVLADEVWASAPNPYLAAAARFATGTPDGMAVWLRACADGVASGAARAVAVADAVRAGRLD